MNGWMAMTGSGVGGLVESAAGSDGATSGVPGAGNGTDARVQLLNRSMPTSAADFQRSGRNLGISMRNMQEQKAN